MINTKPLSEYLNVEIQLCEHKVVTITQMRGNHTLYPTDMVIVTIDYEIAMHEIAMHDMVRKECERLSK